MEKNNESEFFLTDLLLQYEGGLGLWVLGLVWFDYVVLIYWLKTTLVKMLRGSQLLYPFGFMLPAILVVSVFSRSFHGVRLNIDHAMRLSEELNLELFQA